MDTVVVLATWIVVAATFMALLLSQQESVALWVTQLSGAEVQRTAVTCMFATLAGWFLSSLKYERKNAANSTRISASTEPMATVHSTSPAEASPNRIEQGAELTELLRAVGNRLEPSAFSRRTPYSETADASGSMLLLVLSSAPGPAAYSASYILPSDRFEVVVLHSLDHCLQYLEEVPYVPDCMAVEQDDLAGGAEQALQAIAAVRRRLGPADLPILRVMRSGVGGAAADFSQQCWQQQQQQQGGLQGGQRAASSSFPPAPACCASSSPSMWDPAGDTLLLLAQVHPAQLEAIVTARVKLRRQHQQRAAAHATLSLLRHLLPPPAFTDLVTHGSPWAARAHANVSVISAVITLELLLPRNRSTMYTVADSTAAGSVNVKGCSTPLAADCTASTAANQDDAVQLHATPAMAVMHEVCAAFDQLCEVHGITKVGLLGDTYLAAGGLDGAADHPQRVMRAAAGMLAVVEGLQAKHQGQHGQHGQQGQEQGQGQGLPEQQQQRRGREAALLGGPRMEVQIGVHAGPCVAGVVGRTKPVYTLVVRGRCCFGSKRTPAHVLPHVHPRQRCRT
ncbi:hypothetical protein Agub_g8249 [Astrephomene gubernaculifera]|uniref:Guanylate cyclase domain-containing protein n=1 Tax=Astrephomene gubernaculifera TaxID=47775 RepID=A0AAD3HMZ5_9CHLO|nr:hypothetical protein Agub_g8249 [Astrephomene gubernaculifera]